MKNTLFILLLLPSLCFAKAVKYSELSNVMASVQHNCNETYCYVRVTYFFIDKTHPTTYCMRLLNQPILPTGGWVGIYDYAPQANMTLTPLSDEELAMCRL